MKSGSVPTVVAGIAAAIAFCTVLSPPAVADDGFYKGRTMKLIVRSGPGGGYDFYGRLIARHIAKHIPGDPNVVVVNMPGAGGIVAANYMMARAKRNGSEIAILTRELALAQRTGEVGVKYDLRELIPIGSAASSTFLVVMAKTHPVKSYAQLRSSKSTVLFAATGPGAGSYQYPALLKDDGFNVRIITGFVGGQARFLSIERGETHATANSYESTRKAIAEFGLVPILYNGASNPALKGVPHIDTQLSPKGKQLAALLGAPLAAGRPFFTAPGVPADRVKTLRAAFKAALGDPDLLREAERAKRNVAWTDPVEMDRINREILGASDEVITLYRAGAKAPKPDTTKLVKHAGAVTRIKSGGRSVWIDYKGKQVMAKISGSRTRITIDGKKANRKAIKVGMTCRFTYPKPGEEAAMVECR